MALPSNRYLDPQKSFDRIRKEPTTCKECRCNVKLFRKPECLWGHKDFPNSNAHQCYDWKPIRKIKK